MILSKETINMIPATADLALPIKESLEFPERVLQFGTGVLLRGLPDYFIDKANRQNVFNGRIVVVKSTDKGGTEAYSTQDGLYTLCVRGIEDGKQVDEKIVNSSISRVLSATTDWEDILVCAENKDLQIIISNTTETGINLVEEDRIAGNPPSSFPGKLLAFLYRRYKAFNGNPDSGLIILPTELIPDNGKLLKSICLQLAELNHCDENFKYWLLYANDFCNTLVDRIVPGALPEAEQQKVLTHLGYEDDLMIMAEPYCLWAIETSKNRTRSILSFATMDKGVVLADNINKHREIKLRLLNAPHTFSCALAIWCGFSTVKEAMQSSTFKDYISSLMYLEIIPALAGEEIKEEEARIFAGKVLDRFANPFIDHAWLAISVQYSSKMLMRCIPLLVNHYKRTEKNPTHMALGFAAYILFMKSQKNGQGQYMGKIMNKEYTISDDRAAILNTHWQNGNIASVVHSILSDESLWNTNLTELPGFEKSVLHAIERMKVKDAHSILEKQSLAL